MLSIDSSARELEAACSIAAVELLRGRRIAVLTGAGVQHRLRHPRLPRRGRSRAHPDDGAGVPRRRARTQALLGGQPPRLAPLLGGARRTRATARSPTSRRAGVVNGVITQNVDGLHRRAGSPPRRRAPRLAWTGCSCLPAGRSSRGQTIADRIAELNPWLEPRDGVRARPRRRRRGRRTSTRWSCPTCTVCGGMLKPEVVFFGEFVPSEKFAEAAASLVRGADALLDRRLVARRELRHPAARAGRRSASCRSSSSTAARRRATPRASLKIDAGTSEVARRASRSGSRADRAECRKGTR